MWKGSRLTSTSPEQRRLLEFPLLRQCAWVRACPEEGQLHYLGVQSVSNFGHCALVLSLLEPLPSPAFAFLTKVYLNSLIIGARGLQCTVHF